MKKFSLFLLSILFITASFSVPQTSSDWMVYETDKAVFVYQKNVEDLVAGIVSYTNELLKTFIAEFRNDLDQSIVFVLTGCNDVGVVRALSPYKIYIGVCQDSSPDWFTGSWIENSIAFEVAKTFAIDLILKDSSRLMRSFKEYTALNLFIPLWLLDALTHPGMKSVVDVNNDINALSFLHSYIGSEKAFSDEELISGFTPGGTLPRALFALSFMEYLSSVHGNEKILELIGYFGSGLNMLLGVDRAFSEVFGERFNELRIEYIRYIRNRFDTVNVSDLKTSPETLSPNDMVRMSRLFQGNAYYSVVNTSSGLTTLMHDDTALLSVEEEILDFSVIEGTTALTLLEEVDGCLQGRLYITENYLDFTFIQDRVVSAQFMGRDRLAMIVNDNGRYYLESYSLRTSRRVRLYDCVQHFSWLGQLTVSPDSRYIGAKLICEGKSLLLIHDARFQNTRLLDLDHDFNLGNWSQQRLALSIIEGNLSLIGLFVPETSTIAISTQAFGLCSWPSLAGSTYRTVSHALASRVISLSPGLHDKIITASETGCPHVEEQMIEDARPYSLFVDWQNVYTIPERMGVGTVFEDLIGTTKTMLSFGIDGSLSKPFLGIDISSRRLSLVDLELSFFAAQSGSFAELALTRDYGITRNISAGWTATAQLPFKVSLSGSVKLTDSALLLNGLSMASATISLRDTQTLRANTVDGMIELRAAWIGDRFTLSSSGVTRFAVGDPSAVPIRFKGFHSEAPILAGFSAGFEYPFSRRDINYGQLVHFSSEGYGIDTALLFAETIMWRVLIYKYETIYLYSRARLRFQLGINFGSGGALPYFEIAFPFSD